MTRQQIIDEVADDGVRFIAKLGYDTTDEHTSGSMRKLDGNLVLATWNIREFGGNKSGGREDAPLF